jgi:hypothetical protein
MKTMVRICTSALLAMLPVLPAEAQQIGVTSMASGEPRGTPPAQTERILRVGIDIFANERVRTGATDRAHLVFLDGSALTVGAESELTIDRFVYDPNRRAGDLAIAATRGAFRFVGGSISKKSDVIIRTPTAHIGIRGGIATVTVGADGSTNVTFLFGDRLTVSNAAGTQKAVRYGSQIFVPAGGGAPIEPVILPPGTLQAYLSLFEQTQTTGNVIGPGDKVLLEALVANLNAQALPHVDPNTRLAGWLTYLQLVANEGITTNNASRPVGAPPGTGGSASTQGGGNTGGTGGTAPTGPSRPTNPTGPIGPSQ